VPHDARLRLYLIGTLAESEAEALEDQYFDEPELLARLCDVEHDLLDDYAAGRLHGDELSAFERHWLSTKHLRACVVIARALRRLALERGAAPAPRRRLSPLWLGSLALAAAVLLAVFARSRWTTEAPLPAPTLVAVRPTPRLIPTPSATTPALRPARAAPFVLALAPLLTRSGEAQPVAVPRGKAVVRLEFQGEPGVLEQVTRLRARLVTVEGRVIWTGRATVATQRERPGLLARADVPARLFVPDDYIATLEVDGSDEPGRSFRYSLRVVK